MGIFSDLLSPLIDVAEAIVPPIVENVIAPVAEEVIDVIDEITGK